MIDDSLLEDTAEDLFEDAPCGYLSTRMDGTLIKVNRTFETWTGLERAQLLGCRRFQELLAPGARIYHETHYVPLLRMQGEVRGVAVEIVCADGARLPALINSVVRHDDGGHPQVIRTTVFDASDRRRYEQELLRAGRREHEIARRLQQGMLSGELPVADGLEIDVSYRPGVAGLDVGGDWYDAFWLDDGKTVGLVVGDVVGRGIDAAATMGQLRSAVRALASTGLGPAALVEALDRYVRRHGVGRMATLVYAQLGVGSRRLRYAVAGHPPPLFVTPGKDPCLVWDGRSLPLDAYLVSARGRDEGFRELAPGSAVLLYTDGLVETRSRSLDEGMDRLKAEVDAHRDDPVTDLVATVVRTLHGAEHTDDMCLLAARVSA
ncbi:MAG: SpoIIE family protein phosphatase [Solirubrobacterales bacterium]|nr:SpoIIE family protein phosphatase [Solirubrobacterales bacterium]